MKDCARYREYTANKGDTVSACKKVRTEEPIEFDQSDHLWVLLLFTISFLTGAWAPWGQGFLPALFTVLAHAPRTVSGRVSEIFLVFPPEIFLEWNEWLGCLWWPLPAPFQWDEEAGGWGGSECLGSTQKVRSRSRDYRPLFWEASWWKEEESGS